MSTQSRTFHESWYRIADQHICLKPNVTVRRQLFRGRRWYVITDPFSGQFFRMQPSAYRFIASLNTKRSVQDVWNECALSDPDDTPGQEEVIHLLAQLYHANLLHYSLGQASAKLFERYKERKQRILKATLSNIMFFRIPLFDPDELLKKTMPVVKRVISIPGGIVWLAVVISALKIVVDNFQDLAVQSQGILAPSNLFLLYISLILVKASHEFGHAFVVRRFGGEVHTMGVMFLLFNPLPYMDATAAWAFRSKWQRAFVGAAGMIVEIFVAACAVFIWSNTGQGTVHSLAYNIMFIASVSTFLFNINPLLRFDGYYILSDLLDIPNLHSQASAQLTYLVEHYAFGCKKTFSPASNKKEKILLTVFGIASGIYKIIVFTTILLFVADRFLLAGIIMAVICAVSWVIVPVVRLVTYLSTSPRLSRVRPRAVSVCAGTFAAGIMLLGIIPFPNNFKAPGVLKTMGHAVVVNGTDGYVDRMMTASGRRVVKGQVLLSMYNPELELSISEAGAQLEQAKAVYQRALKEHYADAKPAANLIEVINKRINRLKEDKKNLEVKADVDGIWVAPQTKDFTGMWLRRGTSLGQIVDDKNFYFASVIPQQETSFIFSDDIRSSAVRVSGQTDQTIPVVDYTKIPMEHNILPSPALGWRAGGEVPVDIKDTSGMRSAEPFYEVRAMLDPSVKDGLYYGRSGRICYKLAAKPLLQQWWLKLRQLLQKRYQV